MKISEFAVKLGLVIALLCFPLFFSCSNSSSDPDSYRGEEPVLEWVWIPYDSDAFQFSGRTNYEKGDFVILSWSASAVTVGFVGTSLEIKGWTNNVANLDVFVDGEDDPSARVSLQYPGDDPVVVPVVSGLPYGPHVVTLYKSSQSNFGDWYFYGMRIFGHADKSLLPGLPERRIEFIGNSITCGTDVLLPVPGTESDFSHESAFYSYAGQTAKILDAEIYNICSGGHGIYRNYDGSTALTLPIVYKWTGTQSLTVVPWDHDKWHPDIVVVNLGTNDFASGKNDSTQFVNRTVDFIRKIRSYHASAKIVLLDGPMLTGEYMVKCRQYLEIAKDILEGEGVKDLFRFSFEPRGESPYNVVFHPTKEEAHEDAENLSAWIRSEFGWN